MSKPTKVMCVERVASPQRDWQTVATFEGLKDVDVGAGVPHEHVKAWAASLKTERPQPMPNHRSS